MFCVYFEFVVFLFVECNVCVSCILFVKYNEKERKEIVWVCVLYFIYLMLCCFVNKKKEYKMK